MQRDFVEAFIDENSICGLEGNNITLHFEL